MVAAVPVSVLAAGGSSPVGGSGARLTAVSLVPSETNTTTGIGRSICHIIGTQACKDTPSTTSGSGSGGSTDTATDSVTDTSTDAATSSPASPPETGLCSNAKVPGVCSTRSASSTVTVQPPGTVQQSSTKTKATKSTRTTKTTKTTRKGSTTTVTVTVTQASGGSPATTTTSTP
ncbi:MAG TPA: hypothetical protein VGL20_04585 [Candidatus Dormibacteraeota bacterium]